MRIGISIYLKPLKGGDFIPQTEVIVTNRMGQSLLVYLPEVSGVSSDGVTLFVADDGSAYFAPKDKVELLHVSEEKSFISLDLARASAGQVLPMPGTWPLQQRRPVAINLCNCKRNDLLLLGELGIDPELGRFALPPGDPTASQDRFSVDELSVDYVEAFSDSVGARTFDRQLDSEKKPTRLVAQSGDAFRLNPTIAYDHIHSSIQEALAEAVDDDVIEIVDSTTYAMNEPVKIPETIKKTLTLRAAAEQRPCLTFYRPEGTPTSSSFQITSPLDFLELNGLLISGGPLQIEKKIKELQLIACTFDPLNSGDMGSLNAKDSDDTEHSTYILCRCITGGLYAAPGVSQLIIADSIVDQKGELVIGGAPPPHGDVAPSESAAQSVQLERVTIFGRILCDVLNASESLLDEQSTVYDQQAGCIRFSRYEQGSVLPRRYHCVPSDEQASTCSPKGRCFAPQFNSRTFGHPDYAQLASACPQEILTASEAGAEVGAFAGTLNTIRLKNLEIKLQEFLPVGLLALVIAET